jgi:segregation and condensation protein B
MDEKELQAAEQQPESEALPPQAETEPERNEGVAAVEPEVVAAEDLIERQEQPADAAEVQAAELKAILEAIVYVLDEPMPAAQIAQALDRPFDEVETMLKQLAEETARADRGVFIREVAGGYQMATKAEHHEVIRTFVKNLKQPLKLSQAALETLAVIAYKQPITMPEILEIRGVQGGGVVKTLIDRKLVTTAGRKNVIGKPMLYKTTKEFLTQFGLNEIAELPSLKEFEEIRRQSMADEEILGMPDPQSPEEAAEAKVLEDVSVPEPAASTAEPLPVEQPLTEAARSDPPEGEEPQHG